MKELPIHPEIAEVFKAEFPAGFNLLGHIRLIESLYLSNVSPLEESVESIASLLHRVQDHFINYTQTKHKRVAEEKGMELVEVGTEKYAKLEDFEDCQKPLLVAPNTSLICAIFDPKLGYAVSHRELATIEALESFSRRILLSDEFKREEHDVVSLTYGEEQVIPAEIITPKIVSEVLAETIDETFQQFRKMYSKTRLPENVSFFIRGYETGEEEDKEIVLSMTKEYLQREFSLNRKKPGVEAAPVKASLYVQVGCENGLAYGGPNHPFCPVPRDILITQKTL